MAQEKAKLQRHYDLKTALSLGIGTMIGAGIFILPSLAGERAGPAASISYLIGGIIAILTALSLSELATGMSKSGGSYYFINRALGPFFGTVTGIGMWFGLIFASAFYMIGFEYYLRGLIGTPEILGLVLDTRGIALVLTALLVVINYQGTKGVGKFQDYIVYALLLILTLFTIWGAYHMYFGMEEGHHIETGGFFSEENDWVEIFPVAGLVFIGFMGFEVVATVAEEVKNPERNLWLAMIGSVVVVTIFYMAVILVVTGVIPYTDLGMEETPVSAAADVFMWGTLGSLGAGLITFAAILATVSSANASILSSSRIGLAMGEDGILHPWASKIHEKNETPSNSILITGGLILVFLVVGFAIEGGVELLSEAASFMFLLTFMLLHGCVAILRKTDPEWYTPSFRSPLFPIPQILGAGACVGLMALMGFRSQTMGVSMVFLAVIWYKVWSSTKSKVVGEVTKVFDVKPEEAKKVISAELEGKRKVLVPFTNEIFEKVKIKIAAALATRDGALVRLSVAPVPEQTPLDSLDDIDPEIFETAQRVKKLDKSVDIPKVYILKKAHSVPGKIVEISDKESCELILLGKYKTWVPTAKIKETLTNIVLRKAHKDIGVLSLNARVMEKVKNLKEDEQPSIKSIMIPYDDNSHTLLAIEFAKKIAVAEGATVTLLHVCFKKDLEEKTKMVDQIMEDVRAKDFQIESKIATGRSPAKEIIAASKDYDLIVMGASKKWVFNKVFFGSIPDRVMDGAVCPVLIAKRWERTALSQLKGRII